MNSTERSLVLRAEFLGMDVEPERCDFSLLASSVAAMESATDAHRRFVVVLLNYGYPLHVAEAEWNAANDDWS